MRSLAFSGIFKNRSLTDGFFDRRTTAEIQRKVIKQRGRNAISRLLNAKNDKDTISAWKLDLNRMLHVFNVGSIVSTRLLLSLTTHFQTELAVNTHVTVSGMCHDVANTHVIVSDIRRKMLEGGEQTGGLHQLVSDTCVQSIAE